MLLSLAKGLVGTALASHRSAAEFIAIGLDSQASITMPQSTAKIA
jgi:hypothetical protein